MLVLAMVDIDIKTYINIDSIEKHEENVNVRVAQSSIAVIAIRRDADDIFKFLRVYLSFTPRLVSVKYARKKIGN